MVTQGINRREFLERLIMGLEQTIQTMSYEMPYYKPDSLELKYAKKFLDAAQEGLKKAQKELADLPADPGPTK
jgi:hypothetical protein